MPGEAPSKSEIGNASTSQLARGLREPGLALDLGAATVRLRSSSAGLLEPMRSAYRHYPLCEPAEFSDLHVRIDRPSGLRRWWRAQSVFVCDAVAPFEPFPARNALPLFEWGTNWLIGQRLNHLLLLHAGVVERDGRALVMPAVPGSGKSTLAAALSLRGWRLLSDEFGAWDPAQHGFQAVLKPIALKNASIDVIRGFSPGAPIGPLHPNTRKGTVAHLAADRDTVRRRFETARPGAFVLPRWEAGSATRIERVGPEALFPAIAFNAFNYRLIGRNGFDAAVRLSTTCPAWQLTYSDLDDALKQLDVLWQATLDHHDHRPDGLSHDVFAS